MNPSQQNLYSFRSPTSPQLWVTVSENPDDRTNNGGNGVYLEYQYTSILTRSTNVGTFIYKEVGPSVYPSFSSTLIYQSTLPSVNAATFPESNPAFVFPLEGDVCFSKGDPEAGFAYSPGLNTLQTTYDENLNETTFQQYIYLNDTVWPTSLEPSVDTSDLRMYLSALFRFMTSEGLLPFYGPLKVADTGKIGYTINPSSDPPILVPVGLMDSFSQLIEIDGEVVSQIRADILSPGLSIVTTHSLAITNALYPDGVTFYWLAGEGSSGIATSTVLGFTYPRLAKGYNCLMFSHSAGVTVFDLTGNEIKTLIPSVEWGESSYPAFFGENGSFIYEIRIFFLSTLAEPYEICLVVTRFSPSGEVIFSKVYGPFERDYQGVYDAIWYNPGNVSPDGSLIFSYLSDFGFYGKISMDPWGNTVDDTLLSELGFTFIGDYTLSWAVDTAGGYVSASLGDMSFTLLGSTSDYSVAAAVPFTGPDRNKTILTDGYSPKPLTSDVGSPILHLTSASYDSNTDVWTDLSGEGNNATGYNLQADGLGVTFSSGNESYAQISGNLGASPDVTFIVKLAVTRLANEQIILTTDSGLDDGWRWEYRGLFVENHCFLTAANGPENQGRIWGENRAGVFAVSYNSLNDELKIYEDGELIATYTEVDPLVYGANLRIGHGVGSEMGFFDGTIYAILAYDTVLSPSEVKRISISL